jgi:hypothetical protein
VTFTSASGKFLTGLVPGGGAVPEPATWTLMLLGFGMVGYSLRQGKRAALPA